MFDHVPAMPCTNFVQHPHRKKHLYDATPSLLTLGAVHKLLSRKEMMNDPVALQRVREEIQDFRRIWGLGRLNRDGPLRQAGLG